MGGARLRRTARNQRRPSWRGPLLASAWLWLMGCGIGDEIVLGRFGEAGSPKEDAAQGDASDHVDAGGEGGLTDAGADASSGPPPAECVVPSERAVGRCTQADDAGPFSPRVRWRFPEHALVLTQTSPPGTPLVANLTDDNGDGRIDLCDVPDVLLVAGGGADGAALWLLAGDTGHVQALLNEPVAPGTAPAIGDLDADGKPEIVAVDNSGALFAMTPEGEVLWRGATVHRPAGVIAPCYAVSLYDLEGDGSPEILAGFEVFDARGNRRFGATTGQLGLVIPAVFTGCIAPIAADLDGDGSLEVLFGHETLSADGKLVRRHQFGQTPSVPVVANLDDDPELEVVLSAPTMVYVLEHTGEERASVAHECGGNALTVHDFDGDGRDELALPGCGAKGRAHVYTLMGNELVSVWDAEDPLENPAFSSLAAFDFAGRGQADLIYTDPQAFAVYVGATGGLSFEGVRMNAAVLASPVIADVNNDGSADLLVPGFEAGGSAVLTVFSEENLRWMPTRRIWNQHTYHVTNVHEDGRIPRGPADMPQLTPRMRTNAQLEGTSLCVP